MKNTFWNRITGSYAKFLEQQIEQAQNTNSDLVRDLELTRQARNRLNDQLTHFHAISQGKENEIEFLRNIIDKGIDKHIIDTIESLISGDNTCSVESAIDNPVINAFLNFFILIFNQTCLDVESFLTIALTDNKREFKFIIEDGLRKSAHQKVVEHKEWFQKIDTEEFRRQKKFILDRRRKAKSEYSIDILDGILNFMDAVQDHLVECGYRTEKEVFDLAEEESTN